MLGRIALAAVHMKDISAAEHATTTLKNLLPTVANDEMRAWALGYLAAVNEKEYNHYQNDMLAAARALTKPADALWAHVMNLQAAARANDRTTYNIILQQMKAFTGKATVAEALADIPTNDWRAWALGISAEAAATIGDMETCEQLRTPLAAAVIEAVKADSTANAMLAQLCANNAAALTQKSRLTFNAGF